MLHTMLTSLHFESDDQRVWCSSHTGARTRDIPCIVIINSNLCVSMTMGEMILCSLLSKRPKKKHNNNIKQQLSIFFLKNHNQSFKSALLGCVISTCAPGAVLLDHSLRLHL